MGRILRDMYYRFFVALAWIFGWHIILAIELKERLSKRHNEAKV